MAHSILGLTYEQKEMFAEAIAEFNEMRRLEPKQLFALSNLGHVYAILGKRTEARAMIAGIKQVPDGTYVDAFAVAVVHAGLGENDQAFAWLDKALQDRSESLLGYKDAPILDSLRADPRFTDLLRRMNLAP
jgi:Flp pilus assembly protein TadD